MRPARSNGKHPGGRPSKYDPAYPARLLAFIKRGGPRIFKPIVVSDGSREGSRIVDHPIGKLPAFFEGFAASIGVHVATLHDWKQQHPKFHEAYQKAQAVQLNQVLTGMIAGTHQVAGDIFFLKNNHGYKDRLDLNGNGVKGGDTHYHYTTINVDAKPEELVSDILAELSRRPVLSPT
mgnify:CR=1 FL=1